MASPRRSSSRYRASPLFTIAGARKAAPQKARRKFHIFSFLFKTLSRFCALLGAMILISFILIFFSFRAAFQDTETVLPDRMILHYRVDGSLPEIPNQPSFVDPLAGQGPTIRQVLDALEMAGDDPRVDGVIFTLRSGGLSLAHIQELRRAIATLRQKGKSTQVYTASFEHGIGLYYLAAAFEEIWLQPVGFVHIPGLHIEMPFARQTLEKIGISAQIFQRKEYKSLFDTATHDSMPEATREQYAALLDSLGTQITNDIAHDRNMTPDALKTLIDMSLLGDIEALARGLVDRVDYGDVLLKEFEDCDGNRPPLIPLGRYARADEDPSAELLATLGVDPKPFTDPAMEETIKPRVALIHVVGTIMAGDTRAQMPLGFGGSVAAADIISQAIQDAAEDMDVGAIVLRIDSPGGSPSASETIRRALVQARDQGTPVIVSMGETAASGGYWVASGADRIFALPGTLTGSIGVVSGKFIFEDMWDKIGTQWDSLGWGEKSGMFSINRPFSDQESLRMENMVDQVYDAFIKRVAKSRNMSLEEADFVARGRVWTGAQAFEIGLVDGLGGLDSALEEAALVMNLESSDDFDLIILPRPLTPLEEFFKLFGGDDVHADPWGKPSSGISAHLNSLSQTLSFVLRPQDHQAFEPVRVGY